MTIYEKTKTRVDEVLTAMIIKPKYIEIKKNGITKKYTYQTNKEYLKEHYKRVITFVSNMNYNNATQILKIETI